MGATEVGHLGIVRYLCESPRTPQVETVVDPVASYGHLEVVQILHEKRIGRFTASAMDRAAGRGHLDIVKYLHNHRTEGCIADAMDRAAGCSLDIAEFLHENRSEGCTSVAMDYAAKAGMIEVVRFLYQNRTEGCSQGGLPHLLLCGVFDIWNAMRVRCEGDDGAAEAMALAGYALKHSTIRFLCEEMHRTDLMHHVMEGAANRHGGIPLRWLQEWYPIESTCCRFDAVKNSINKRNILVIQYLISICCDASLPDAIEFARKHHAENIAEALEAWQPVKREFEEKMIPELALEQDRLEQPSSVRRRSIRWYSLGQLEVWSWPIHAILNDDFALLQSLRAFAQEPKYQNNRFYSFQLTRSVAIALGKREVLERLLEATDIPLEATLHYEAIFYRRLDIAEWLMEHYPLACTDFDGLWWIPIRVDHRVDVGICEGIMTWLASSAKARKFVDFSAVAQLAIIDHHIGWLQVIFETEPIAAMTRESLLEIAIGQKCDIRVFKYIIELGLYHCSYRTMDKAANNGREDVLDLLTGCFEVRCSREIVRYCRARTK